MNIPPQAAEAAAESLSPGLFTLSDHEYGIRFDNPIDYRKLHQSDALEQARSVLAAALPHIEAALRTQIANDIRTKGDWVAHMYYAEGREDSARIAEEGVTQ